MSYTKNTWVDQDVERPKTYEVTNNQDGSITLTDSFGLVTELGTPVNAANMNHIEDGIEELDNSKADTDLSNLTATSSTNFDGQWVNKYVELASQVNIGPSATLTYSLASYLPDDNYDYEVQLSATGTTLGLTSATMTIIGGSGLLRGFLFANQNTTNATVTGAGNMIVPVPHSNRNININNGASSTCTLNAVRVYGYRRIGTNT